MRSHVRHLLSLAAVCGITACYGAAPPRPTTIPLPPLVPGTQITLTSETATKIETVHKKDEICPEGQAPGSPGCIANFHNEREPVTTTTSTMRYGDTPIDRAQFNVLTDLDRQHRLDRLADLSRRCSRARIPAWVGLGLVATGPLVWAEGSAGKNAVAADIGLAILAAGVASYAYGYFVAGGSNCDEAAGLYNDLENGLRIGQMEVYNREDEIKALADRFNDAAGSVTRQSSRHDVPAKPVPAGRRR